MADRDAQFEERINLASEPPIALGAALACPPTRELIAGAQTVVLEPRVMQVLIALARTPGAIITRDQLILQCWHGTVVGENAIQRTISRLRQLNADLGPLFEIDTINKVGYRLRTVAPGMRETAPQNATPPGSEPAPPASALAPARFSRRAAVGVLGGGSALALTGGLVFLRRSNQTDNLAANDLLAQSEQALRADTPEADARAVALLTKATELAPRRADLWGKLALARWRLEGNGDPAVAAALVEGIEDAARRALSLAPTQPDARASLALLPGTYGAWLAAEGRMKDVLKLEPAHVQVHDALAFFYVAVGRAREGALDRLAYVAGDPLNVGQVYRLTYAYWILGRISDADRNAQRAMRLWPHHPGVWVSRLYLLAFTDRAERALQHIDDGQRRPDMPPSLFDMLRAAVTALATRRPADVARAVDLIMADVAASASGSVNAILMLSAMGEIDRAFAVAEAYLLERGKVTANVNAQPGERTVKDQHERKTNMLFIPPSAPMRADPRFLKLTEAMGLARYWKEAGATPDFLAGR